MEYISKYKKSVKGKRIPVVPVNITGFYRKSANFNMLIDSGSDVTVLNLSAGKYLGFDFDTEDKKAQITGIGGSLTAIYKNVRLNIFDKVFDIPVCWVLNEKIPLLIGRDVFDFFHITFKQDEKVTVFKWISK